MYPWEILLDLSVHLEEWKIRVLYSPPRLTTGIRWIQWIPVDFQWIQQDYILVITRLQIYPVDLVDS